MNYWERWIGAWKKKTGHLSLIEKGAYGELLDYQYANDAQFLPLDSQALYRIAGAIKRDECAAVDSVMRQCYERSEQGFANSRATEEIEKRAAFVSKQRELAQRRWSKPDADGEVKPKKSVPKANGKHPISDDWLPSDPIIAKLSDEFKLTSTDLQRYFDHFVSSCKAKGYKYADFDAAFVNSVRTDWPKLRDASGKPKQKSTNPMEGAI